VNGDSIKCVLDKLIITDSASVKSVNHTLHENLNSPKTKIVGIKEYPKFLPHHFCLNIPELSYQTHNQFFFKINVLSLSFASK
jgi:hypothetical protein